jgi:RNA polymerase sigma-70 factor (ECF subfamily)
MEQSKNEDEYEKLEVRHAVSLLEEELRILVILYYFEDMTMVEISGLLNIPEGTVKSRLHRARLKLAESLKVQTERSAYHE